MYEEWTGQRIRRNRPHHFAGRPDEDSKDGKTRSGRDTKLSQDNSKSDVERGSNMETLEKEISADERGLLREVIRALRSLRYGSVNLTVHDGRLVEIQKIEKIRMNGLKAAL
jgi:hypothetical protein